MTAWMFVIWYALLIVAGCSFGMYLQRRKAKVVRSRRETATSLPKGYKMEVNLNTHEFRAINPRGYALCSRSTYMQAIESAWLLEKYREEELHWVPWRVDEQETKART